MNTKTVAGRVDCESGVWMDAHGQSIRWAIYSGPSLSMHYTNASDLVVLYYIPMSDGWSVRVVGNPHDASYEWLIECGGKIEHSDCGYGDSDIALRDGLIAMHGLPNAA